MLFRSGVSIIPFNEFTDFDSAIEYVKANPAPYVIKPSGEAQNIKRLLFVGQEDDGIDVIHVLESYKRVYADKVKIFQLQRRMRGVEVAVGAFFNYLSSPEVQADWHQFTGYLPITKAAAELTRKQGFYDKNPGTDVAIKQMTAKAPTENSKGLRFGDRKSTRLNSSHMSESRMPSSA